MNVLLNCRSSGFGKLVQILIVFGVLYCIYKCCVGSRHRGRQAAYAADSSGSSTTPNAPGPNAGGGGFWTGMYAVFSLNISEGWFHTSKGICAFY